MGKYVIKGKRKGKSFTSRKTFNTEEGALKYGYNLTYNPGGNTKRKNQISGWYVSKKK